LKDNIDSLVSNI